MVLFHITYNDGKNKHAVALKLRGRAPQDGDVLVALRGFETPVHSYKAGDEFHLIRRTEEAPYHIRCSLGNWVVECKHQTSVWSNVEWAIKDGVLGFKELKGVNHDPAGNHETSHQGRVHGM